jgi:TPR repeat protein
MKMARGLSLLAGLLLAPASALADESAASISRPEGSGPVCDRLAGHPDDPDLHGKGVVFESIAVAAAEPACRAANGERPDERRYLFELGRVLRKKEDFAAALPLYRQASDKGSTIALLGIGLLYENGEGVDSDYDKAAGYYQKAIDAGFPLAFGYLADLYNEGNLGDPDPVKAIDLYRKGADAGDFSALNQLGIFYQWGRGVAKDVKQAETLFRRAIASGHADVAAEGKNDLAWLWMKTGTNLADAFTLATAAVAEVRADDPGTKGRYRDTLAWAKHLRHADAAALVDEQAAIDSDTEDPTYRDRLGDIYAALGEKAKAKEAWQKALSLTPPSRIDEPDWNPVAIQKKVKSLP